MFICDACKKTSQPNEAMTKVVTKTKIVHHVDKELRTTGTGTQIVSEAKVCPRCVNKHD